MTVIAVVNGSPADMELTCQVYNDLAHKAKGFLVRLVQLMPSGYRDIEGNFAKQLVVATQESGAWIKKYDQFVVLGDRPEIAAVALMACAHNKVVHHLYAGDVSGCVDDHLRGVISAASTHLYCVGWNYAIGHALQNGTNRIKTVNNVAPLPLVVADKLPPRMKTPFALAGFHPETSVSEPTTEWIEDIVDEANREQINLYFMEPNADPGSQEIRRVIDEAVVHYQNIRWLDRVDKPAFARVMKEARWIAGNSSAFVLEAPRVTKAPVKLYGNRQHDRECVTGEGLPSMTNVLVQHIKEEIPTNAAR